MKLKDIKLGDDYAIKRGYGSGYRRVTAMEFVTYPNSGYGARPLKAIRVRLYGSGDSRHFHRTVLPQAIAMPWAEAGSKNDEIEERKRRRALAHERARKLADDLSAAFEVLGVKPDTAMAHSGGVSVGFGPDAAQELLAALKELGRQEKEA